ncbi:ASCH domain-containing protein [Curtobacterium ammoniigenes]|uniref:ASCH domain-containing protein n=1 Tax=Curtobacterium ammoniigenes TaxID=395387 RepID=UPI000B24C4FA|nr:ASCH domain-containing protein [Curtobacterium ammoniigenes]
MITGSSSLLEFWSARRAEAPELPAAVPAAWAFGATPTQADKLLELVLRGIKTATSSSMWDYDAAGEAPPEVGELSVVLDGTGEPRAIIETTSLQIVPFHQVDAEHARAEGEGDRTLGYWRAAHERYWREHSENPRGFEPDMPVLCERFRLLWPEATAAD